MSITVKLGYTTSEKIALSKNFEQVVSLSGSLINDTDILNPSIRLKCSAETIAGCNYMKIDDFHRNFFITGIVALTNGTCMVSGHVDVLSTYASGIRANTAVIGRQATKGVYNLLLTDATYKVKAKPNISVLQFPSGFSNQYYILTVAGR